MVDNAALARNAEIKQQLVIVVAAPISMGKVPGLPGLPGPPSVLLFINFFTPAKLAALGKMLDVRALRVNDRDALQQPRMTLGVIEGESVVLRWQAKDPGTRLLTLLAALALLTGSITRRVSQQALHNAVLSDRRFAILTVSQRELANSEARFRDLAEAASGWIWETDKTGGLSISLSASIVSPAIRSPTGRESISIAC